MLHMSNESAEGCCPKPEKQQGDFFLVGQGQLSHIAFSQKPNDHAQTN